MKSDNVKVCQFGHSYTGPRCMICVLNSIKEEKMPSRKDFVPRLSGQTTGKNLFLINTNKKVCKFGHTYTGNYCLFCLNIFKQQQYMMKQQQDFMKQQQDLLRKQQQGFR